MAVEVYKRRKAFKMSTRGYSIVFYNQKAFPDFYGDFYRYPVEKELLRFCYGQQNLSKIFPSIYTL